MLLSIQASLHNKSRIIKLEKEVELHQQILGSNDKLSFRKRSHFASVAENNWLTETQIQHQ